MDSSWFKEERTLPKAEQQKAKEEVKKTLLNSKTFAARLERILEERLEETLRSDEEFTKSNWEREAVANASRRKTLREIITLIKLK